VNQPSCVQRFTCFHQPSPLLVNERHLYDSFKGPAIIMRQHGTAMDRQLEFIFEIKGDYYQLRRASQVSWFNMNRHRYDFDLAVVDLVTLFSRLANLPTSPETKLAWALYQTKDQTQLHACRVDGEKKCHSLFRST